MTERKFYTVKDVVELLGVSRSSAYRIIKSLNDDLMKKGYIVIPGKVSKKYFDEKIYS